jgi:ParB family transcriptional regulator, chromosome partitioning protein
MKKQTEAKKSGSMFAALGDVLAGGFDATVMSDASEQMVKLTDIEIQAQVREEFEDPADENSLANMGKSLRQFQIQAIVVRPNRRGSALPYLLVAGERRVRAARIEGLTELRALVKPLTDEQAEDVQLAENIHRKNLTQIEEARRVQRDLDRLGGDFAAVMAKHNKSRAWLSKTLSLLSLPTQAARLVKENVSADVEVITAVKTIEKADPVKAAALVDELKVGRGKINARDKVQAVKDEVKPPKKQRQIPPARPEGTTVATGKDRTQEAPSKGNRFAGAKSEAPAVLDNSYFNIFEHGSNPQVIFDVMKAEDREAAEEWLRVFYEAGKQSKDSGRGVIQGMRNGQFATDGSGAFALVAFLHGADHNAKFNFLNILGCAKP